MIHQHILATPRPGMSEFEFQDYWRYQHALKFARKIPQIRKYKVDSRIDIANQPQELGFSGIAEIWLDNEKAQADSLKTREFLEGAKLDEPKWAASWQSVVLDTESVDVLKSEAPEDREFPEYKILLFKKRKRGMSIDEFRNLYSTKYCAQLKEYDLIKKVTGCLSKQNLYDSKNVEPSFDAITHVSFNSLFELKEFSFTKQFNQLLDPSNQILTDEWGIVTLSVRSEWILGPSLRPY